MLNEHHLTKLTFSHLLSDQEVILAYLPLNLFALLFSLGAFYILRTLIGTFLIQIDKVKSFWGKNCFFVDCFCADPQHLQ